MRALRMALIVFANTVILFALAVVGTHVLLTERHDAATSHRFRGLPAVVKRNYAHMTPADVDDLLKATATMRYRFAPWVGARERPIATRFVNVNAHGIRSNGTPRESITQLADAIWVFGGSTAFGYGVTDRESIPAQLEAAIGRPVMNFGVAAFFSAQENLLLFQVLRFGYRPSHVVFFDGINESCEVVDYQARPDPRFDTLLDDYQWNPIEIAKPVLYVAGKLIDQIRVSTGMIRPPPHRDELSCDRPGGPQPLRKIHAQILAERELLCRLYDLPCTTFVQPFAGLHGRHEDFDLLPESVRKRYRDKFAHLEGNWRAAQAVFVTDVLDHHPAHAYVDAVHYSKDASALVARAMAEHLRGQLR